MPSYEWKIPLSPVAASRPRTGKYGGYYVGPYKKWRAEVPELIYEAIGDWDTLKGDLRVSLHCYVTKPKSTKLQRPKADLDNYLKAIFDAFNGKVWEDDAQIGELGPCSKNWAEPNQPGYFIVRVETLD